MKRFLSSHYIESTTSSPMTVATHAAEMTAKVFDLLRYTAFFFLLINAILVVYRPIMDVYNDSEASAIDEVPHKSAADCYAASRRTGNVDSISLRRRINYSHIATAVPHLEADCRSTTLTRLGTDLSFSCPKNSLMLQTESRSSTPLHDNCPTAFIVGARKAGTSSLYQYLSNHPDFEGTSLDLGPKAGETFYFSAHYDDKSWDSYLSFFPSGGVMTGDASVGNLVHCLVPKRMFGSCGKQAKIIILLRNPVKRFVSNFLMRARLSTNRIRNTTALTTVVKSELDTFFAEVFQRNIVPDVSELPQKWTELRCLFLPSTNMVFEGLYYVHVMNWLCNFPPENILVINSEEFYRNTSVILKQVLQFLDLRPLPQDTLSWITSTVYNQGKYYEIPPYQRLTPMDGKKLARVYEPFNRALFELLDWKTVNWSN